MPLVAHAEDDPKHGPAGAAPDVVHDQPLDRACGTLWGLALGDALGMPTQCLSRARAEQVVGQGPGFVPGPADNPISPGQPAATVTDDTEQAFMLADLLVAGRGTVDAHAFAEALLAWEADMAARGSLDLLGPSTKAGLAALRDGLGPGTTGRQGTTNGAAMRIAPVGIAVPEQPKGRIVAAVHQACRVTHDTPVAMAGAHAVATVVSHGIDGSGPDTALDAGLRAAHGRVHEFDRAMGTAVRLTAPWHPVPGRGPRRTSPDDDAALLDGVEREIGTGLETSESVPAAFAVALAAEGSVLRAAWLAARLGGDSDTIGAMAAAMTGACTGASSLPPEHIEQLRRANPALLGGDRPVRLAQALLALRLPGRPTAPPTATPPGSSSGATPGPTPGPGSGPRR